MFKPVYDIKQLYLVLPWSAKVKPPLGANFWHLTRVLKLSFANFGTIWYVLYLTNTCF